MRQTVALAGLGLAAQVAAQGPIQMPFSTTQTFGEDGPWPAVELAVGSNEQKIHLLPGGWFESDIYSSTACGSTTDPSKCRALKAGVFDVDLSSPPLPPNQVTKDGFVDQWNAGPETNKKGQGTLMMDKIAFESTSGQKIDIPQVGISLMESVSIQLPSGQNYMPDIGFLGLGAPVTEATWDLINNSTATFQLIPGHLYNQSITSSNSFGLHYGSVSNGQPASLTFGGYDQSRIVGDVGVYKTSGVGGGEPIVDVVDVTIGVIEGSSPFNTSDIGSLYRPGNTRNTSSPMSLNPTVPYMQLPPGICEAVAQYLPVTMNSDLGLYLWNVNDPQYSNIINSGAYLAFSLAQEGKNNLVIKVPFSVLSLTLSYPLVNNDTPYFPCKPSQSTDGRYYLGRTFLQAAYLAVNWHQSTFFVAQAPGPDCEQPNLLSFSPSDVTMKSMSEDKLASSWRNHWSEVANENSAATKKQTTSLSPGAKAGIGVAVVVVLGLIGLAIFLYFRRKRRSQNEQQTHEWYGASAAGEKHRKLPSYDSELDGTRPPLPQYPGYVPHGEMEGSRGFAEHQRAELGANYIQEMQARNSSSPDSPRTPVEIHGREVAIAPVAVQRLHHSSESTSSRPSPISPSERSSRNNSTNIRKSMISRPILKGTASTRSHRSPKGH